MTHEESLTALFDPIRSVEASAVRLLETTRGNRRRAILLAQAWSTNVGGQKWGEVAGLLAAEDRTNR